MRVMRAGASVPGCVCVCVSVCVCVCVRARMCLNAFVYKLYYKVYGWLHQVLPRTGFNCAGPVTQERPQHVCTQASRSTHTCAHTCLSTAQEHGFLPATPFPPFPPPLICLRPSPNIPTHACQLCKCPPRGGSSLGLLALPG